MFGRATWQRTCPKQETGLFTPATLQSCPPYFQFYDVKNDLEPPPRIELGACCLPARACAEYKTTALPMSYRGMFSLPEQTGHKLSPKGSTVSTSCRSNLAKRQICQGFFFMHTNLNFHQKNENAQTHSLRVKKWENSRKPTQSYRR